MGNCKIRRARPGGGGVRVGLHVGFVLAATFVSTEVGSHGVIRRERLTFLLFLSYTTFTAPLILHFHGAFALCSGILCDDNQTRYRFRTKDPCYHDNGAQDWR